jgi:hypothetical protein
VIFTRQETCAIRARNDWVCSDASPCRPSLAFTGAVKLDSHHRGRRIPLPESLVAKQGHDIERLERGSLQLGVLQVVPVDMDDHPCQKRFLKMKKPPESGFPAPSKANQMTPRRDCQTILFEVRSSASLCAACDR